MTRAALFLLAAAALARAASAVILVDGREIAGLLLAVEEGRARVQVAGGGVEELAAGSIVLATLPDAKRSAGGASPFNLYLRNGDRIRGSVAGEGDRLRLVSPVVSGLEVGIDEVRAVRFGRLLGPLQAAYGEVFDREMERGRDVVVIQRDTRPFPVYARVLALGDAALTARIEDARRDLDLARVYGFVRIPDGEPPRPSGVLVRAHLAGGERITIPLSRIGPAEIEGGGVRVARDHVERLEFLGEHIAHLSEFDPIDAKQTPLFGPPAGWRRDGMALGGPLRLGGRVYDRGLGTLAHARLEYVLGGRWDSLFVRCGIDDAAGPEGDAVFRIAADGRVLAEVRRRRGEAPEAVRVDVNGVDRLVLEALPGDSYTSDFCDWADARVFTARPAGPDAE